MDSKQNTFFSYVVFICFILLIGFFGGLIICSKCNGSNNSGSIIDNREMQPAGNRESEYRAVCEKLTSILDKQPARLIEHEKIIERVEYRYVEDQRTVTNIEISNAKQGTTIDEIRELANNTIKRIKSLENNGDNNQ